MNRYFIAIGTIILFAALYSGGMYLSADTPQTHGQIGRNMLVGAIVGAFFAVKSFIKERKTQ